MTDRIKTVTLSPAEQVREAAAQVAVQRKGHGWEQGPAQRPYDRGYIAACEAIAAAIRALPLPPEPAAPDAAKVQALVEVAQAIVDGHDEGVGFTSWIEKARAALAAMEGST